MAGVKGKSGGSRRGAGRKSKSKGRALIETLTPYEDSTHAALFAAIKRGEPWAIKLFFAYRYGKPKRYTPKNLEAFMRNTPIPFLEEMTTEELEAELANLE